MVILNVQEHGVRARYVEPSRPRVLGAVLGKRENKGLELNNTVEIKYKMNGENLVIDEEFLKNRLKDYKTMYPSLELVGWYSTGSGHNIDTPFNGDLKI